MPELTARLPPLETILLILLPVVGFLLLAIGGRTAYERLSGRPLPLPHRVRRSNIGHSLGELEKLAQRYYQAQGYAVVHSGEAGGELMVLKEAGTTLVQCLLDPQPVETAAIEQAVADRDRLAAQRAVLIAPAGFTPAARRQAAARGVEVRDQAQIELMRSVADRHGL